MFSTRRKSSSYFKTEQVHDLKPLVKSQPNSLISPLGCDKPSSTSPLQLSAKFFNYYAQIRRDLFEFLLRIRSDPSNRLILLNKTDRRKHLISKFLLLRLDTTTSQLVT